VSIPTTLPTEDYLFSLVKSAVREQIAAELRKDMEPLIQRAAEEACKSLMVYLERRHCDLAKELTIRFMPSKAQP
jgi:hypothetical protein